MSPVEHCTSEAPAAIYLAASAPDRMPPTPTSGIESGSRVRSIRSTAVDLFISGSPDSPPVSRASGSSCPAIRETGGVVGIGRGSGGGRGCPGGWYRGGAGTDKKKKTEKKY